MKRLLVLGLVFAGCGSLLPGQPPGALGGEVGTLSGQLRVFQVSGSALSSPVRTPVPVPASPLGGTWRLPPHVQMGEMQRLPASEDVIPGDVLVRFAQAGVQPKAALALLGMEGLTAEHGGYGSRFLHVVRYRHADGTAPSVEETRALAEALGSRPGVRFATVNRWYRLSATPNDPLFTVQWHYRVLNLPAAWDVESASPGVVVALVDNGVRPHPDLTPRLLPGADTVSDLANSGDGDGRDNDPTDPGMDLPRGTSSWHGSHVAGTVGAATENGLGVAGVSWDVRLLPVRVVGRKGGTTADVVAGIEWAMGEDVPGVPQKNANPAQVINMSLGATGQPDPAYQDVIDRANAKGIVVVVAAGNENESTALKVPCNQRGVVCVGATRLDGRRASYSNFGPEVDVMAPGGEGAEDLNLDELPDAVLSTYFDQQGNPGYGFLQGTSMAAPHVSGVVALLKAANPALTPTEVEALLKDTAATSFRCPEGCGAGLVNAQAALLRATGKQGPAGPGQLVLPAGGLYLSGDTTVGLTLLNTGGAPLQVAATFTAGPQGGAVRFPAGTTVELPAGQERVLQVASDVAGLAPGLYEGTLQLTPAGQPPQALPVRIRVGTPPGARPARVAVVFQDETGQWQVAGRTDALPENDYRYSVDVPPGTYAVLAGIDENENGIFFEPGERSGMYRSVDDPEPVTVVANEETTGVDFDLVPYSPSGGEAHGTLGDGCDEAADCPGGVCELGMPGGYCTLDCSAASCPAGSACYPVGARQECLASCTAPGRGQSSCRDGQVCLDDGAGGGFCQPRCREGSCPAGKSCSVTSGTCE